LHGLAIHVPDMEDSGTAFTRRGREGQVEATEILQALFTSDAAGDPYLHYADLLATGEACHPAQWSSVVVFGYAAIESVLRDPVFEVQGDAGLDVSFPAWREHPSMSKNSVIDLNGGEHARVRGLMSRAFSRRRVDSLAKRDARGRRGHTPVPSLRRPDRHLP